VRCTASTGHDGKASSEATDCGGRAAAPGSRISRSTLHRFFVDRGALIEAFLTDADEAFDGVELGRTSAGSAPDELCRQIERVVPLGHWVLFLWSDPARFADHPLGAQLFSVDASAPALALIEQGQRDGDIDPDVPAPWLVSVFFSLLYGAAQFTVQGRLSGPEAARLAIRALRGALGTDRDRLRSNAAG
jgi:hypothetical protein